MSLETIQSLLRALLWVTLAVAAFRVILGHELPAVTVRARRWFAVALLGATTQVCRAVGAPPEVSDLTSTVTVAGVVLVGLYALDAHRN